MILLKPEVLERIKEDEPVLFKIALALERKFRTVQLWIANNDVILTTSTVLDIIREHYGLSEDVELTEKKRERRQAAIRQK